MKFQSAKSAYVVLPFDSRRDVYGRQVESIKGLRAEFKGHMPKVFDSVVAQQEHGWTDEERLHVERFLLTHKDFGRIRIVDGGSVRDRQVGNIEVHMLYFGPGQNIPKEHAELISQQRWYKAEQIAGTANPMPVDDEEASSDLCSYRSEGDTDDEIVACTRRALKDKLYCRKHLEAAVSA